jgi:RNA ligase
MHLHDLIDPAELTAAVNAKHIRIQNHPDLPLHIYNYTDMCMYDRGWNDTTTRCRGLIADQDGNLLARPWAKFFNHGEHDAATLDLTASVQVTDKKDGSLGILYPIPGGASYEPIEYAVATRGSFASEQAVHATAIYQDRYTDAWAPMEGVTYLFEICYPANRIVLDYGDLDDLILLGAVHINTGTLYGPNDSVCSHWPGPRTETYAHNTLADALTAAPRPNAEGLVIRYLDGPSAGLMLKIKQDDYVIASRLMTGLTARRLWERLAVWSILDADPATPARSIGQALHLDVTNVQAIIDHGPDWLDEVRKTTPEEFTAWIDTTIADLRADVASVAREVAVVTAAMLGRERRDIAAAIAQHRYRGLIFAALDGKPITAGCWQQIRPAHERPFMDRREDVA